MPNKFTSFFSRIIKNSTTIKQEPLNKVSLILLIIVDIFVLTNVFWGLSTVTNTIAAPNTTHPCFYSWQNYKNQSSDSNKDYNFINNFLNNQNYGNYSNGYASYGNSYYTSNTYTNYQDNHTANNSLSLGSGILVGEINPTCIAFNDKVTLVKQNPELIEATNQLRSNQNQRYQLDNQINTLQSQYDSTLLEKISNQDLDKSINLSNSSQTKSQIQEAQNQIESLNIDNERIKQNIILNRDAQSLISYVKDDSRFQDLEKSYTDYSFWYQVWIFVAQLFFLIPLILLTYLLYILSRSKKWDIASLLSWNLLLIFSIPAIIKVFEFLQFGVLVKFIIDLIVFLVGNLAFLGSYVLIVLIPLVGFLMILFFQKVVFRPKDKIPQRLQAQQCFSCAFKLNRNEFYCPNCGNCQYEPCKNCQKPKYRFTNFCQHCGKSSSQAVDQPKNDAKKE